MQHAAVVPGVVPPLAQGGQPRFLLFEGLHWRGRREVAELVVVGGRGLLALAGDLRAVVVVSHGRLLLRRR
jgi:hypothetical protein